MISGLSEPTTERRGRGKTSHERKNKEASQGSKNRGQIPFGRRKGRGENRSTPSQRGGPWLLEASLARSYIGPRVAPPTYKSMSPTVTLHAKLPFVRTRCAWFFEIEPNHQLASFRTRELRFTDAHLRVAIDSNALFMGANSALASLDRASLTPCSRRARFFNR